MKHLRIHTRNMTFPTLEQGEGPVVLCLHGFPDTHRTFRHLLPRLAEAGYRAVAPTLPGYHPDCLPPSGRFHLSTVVDDILGIIDALGEERVHLVGHDWGAALGYGIAARAPDRLHSLTTATVPMPRGMRRGWSHALTQLRCSWYIGFFQFKALADAQVSAKDWAFIARLWRAWSPDYTLPGKELQLIKDALARPGVKAAALGYYRDLFDFGSQPWASSRALYGRRVHVPTLALYGDRDGCIDAGFFLRSMHPNDFPGGLEVEVIPGSGHFPHLEAPDAFTTKVLGWIRRHGPQTT